MGPEPIAACDPIARIEATPRRGQLTLHHLLNFLPHLARDFSRPAGAHADFQDTFFTPGVPPPPQESRLA